MIMLSELQVCDKPQDHFNNILTNNIRNNPRHSSNVNVHSLREYCFSLWTDLSSSVILELFELRFPWSVLVVSSATLILLCNISLTLASYVTKLRAGGSERKSRQRVFAEIYNYLRLTWVRQNDVFSIREVLKGILYDKCCRLSRRIEALLLKNL